MGNERDESADGSGSIIIILAWEADRGEIGRSLHNYHSHLKSLKLNDIIAYGNSVSLCQVLSNLPFNLLSIDGLVQ